MVTGAGFWRATRTDRPAKGVKTDWMMNEFRLPSLTDSLSVVTIVYGKPKKLLAESWTMSLSL